MDKIEKQESINVGKAEKLYFGDFAPIRKEGDAKWKHMKKLNLLQSHCGLL